MKEFTHRIATYEDIPTIEVLMELSINELLGPLLSAEQLEASFDSMGLDDQLIKDGTYFMIFCDEVFVGCGGWSNRETLFGGNHTPNRDDNFLDPLKDSARIRAMYTHPDWARQGIGSLVMHLGENAAKKLLENKTTLISGHSGVGKSSLINYLFPHLDLSTQEVSDWSGKGLHTTTFAQMYDLPEGGAVIDTPGMRELGLVNLEKEELAQYFPEMRAKMNGCQFNNCQHINEPGCAVKAAVEKGIITEARFYSYVDLWHGIQGPMY
mgnify:CR=1 FL=1